KLVQQHTSCMEKMECLLSIWLHDLYKQNIPISLAFIQEKTMSLYKDNKIEGQIGESGPLNASRELFHRFQKRYGFKNVQVQGEVGNADKDAAEAFPEMLKTIIKEGSYNPQQVFNADKMGLYLKLNEKFVPGFKALKDRKLLLGGSARGDMKLEPLLVYRSENPLAMKNYVNSCLPVIWKSHRKAWMTRQLFHEWFEMKKYCEETNLMFKILLILDNASAH
uniref:HTH CENPB-type domain-containing protein n=1 Tax=Pelodiscus sinensis TaxID=13735 RepID=K7G394_PELSI